MWAVLAAMMGCSDGLHDYQDALIVGSVGPNPAVRGSELVISGQSIGGIKEVIFPDGVSVKDFKEVTSGSVKLIVPDNATEGFVKVVFGGYTYTTKFKLEYVELVKVTNLSPLNRELNIGDKLTVVGNFLNKIVSLSFSNEETITSANFVTQTNDKIEVFLPAGAVSGKICLTDKYGNKIYSEQEIRMARLRPTMTGFAPATINATETFDIEGTLLNLVTSIKINGVDAEFTRVSAEKLTVQTTAEHTTGKIKIACEDDYTLESETELTIIPLPAEPEEIEIWKGSLLGSSGSLTPGTGDEWRNAGLKSGDKIRIYFSSTNLYWWEIKIFGENWESNSKGYFKVSPESSNKFSNTNSPKALANGYISFEPSQKDCELLVANKQSIFLLQAANVVTITKISLVKE